jgi:thioesterase domain-containing protein
LGANFPITEQLIAIWQRVLRRSSVGIDDNFFDLGGDASLADELFSEIALACGRRLPPPLICLAPTISALATTIEQPGVPRIPPLVLLKAGDEQPPIFMAHGLGGSILEIRQLARSLETRHPVFGMQDRGVDGVEPPHEKIEEMAQYHLDAIKAAQLHGPYCLIGYSLGGLVTLEMAQRLAATGERIALLVMLDSYPDFRFLSLHQQTRLGVRLAKRYAVAAAHWRPRGSQSLATSPGRWPAGEPLSLAIARVQQSHRHALRRYRPPYYQGQIKFVKAAIASVFPDDPVAVWGKLAGGLEVWSAPGDHTGMIRSNCKSLAALLSRFLASETPSGESG